jgi:hypothetical protein
LATPSVNGSRAWTIDIDVKVIITPPCILFIENLYKNIQGCVIMTLTSTPTGRGRRSEGKNHRVAQTLGQLQASDRDFQSKCWANLKILSHPRGFQQVLILRLATLCFTQESLRAMAVENGGTAAEKNTVRPVVASSHTNEVRRMRRLRPQQLTLYFPTDGQERRHSPRPVHTCFSGSVPAIAPSRER